MNFAQVLALVAAVMLALQVLGVVVFGVSLLTVLRLGLKWFRRRRRDGDGSPSEPSGRR